MSGSFQHLDAPLTRSATFLIVNIKEDKENIQNIRKVLSRVGHIADSIYDRDPDSSFSCNLGIGSDAWDVITRIPRPKELHTFREIKGKTHTAVSTPGDILFHVRADRRDLCFEFERMVLDALGSSISIEDETVGFRYFEDRDLLGFVDGTANPIGEDALASIIVSGDSNGVGGSYIVTQKYIHHMSQWQRVPGDKQQDIIGRTKEGNVELDDAEEDQQKSHKTLATITDNDGAEHDIVRDNMPFGSPASSTFGTYFIGYSKDLWVTERMLERMFIGDPPGLHDRILDYSVPLTGNVFFAPSRKVLEGLAHNG